MITSRRDYLVRLIAELGELVARIAFRRKAGAQLDAIELAVQGMERLFGRDRAQLFQFTPDQQWAMLTLDEAPENARDKALLYARLNAEAGQAYTQLGNAAFARVTFANALRFALRARRLPVDAPPPGFAPDVDELTRAVGPSLDDELKRLLADSGGQP